MKSAALVFKGNTFELTEGIANNLDKALAIEDECDGALDGMLEQINVHLGANTFTFTRNWFRKVTCRFPSSLYDNAVAAVGRKVEVCGVPRIRSGAQFPHQISVSGIEVFPHESELPDSDDLRGPGSARDGRSE